MIITNELVKESFSFSYSRSALTSREEDQTNLNDIIDFCRTIQETVCYDESLLELEVEDGILLCDILWGFKNGASKDGADFIREMIQKKCKVKKEEGDNCILCSCGVFDGAAGTLRDYAKKRQSFLRTMKNDRDFGSFMRTCFPNSIFANDCEKELIYIKDFAEHVDEITDCLSLLDEKAISLYYKYHTNLQEARNILQAEMKRTCAPDPKHKKQLRFEFSYEEEVDGKNLKREKTVECQPHFKLIHDGSDLRIYFYWQDDEVGHGEKVLIGRVGRHPWKK